MTAYRLLHLLKFVGVMMYAGGLVASFLASTTEARKRAVHGIASPGLLFTWVAGYFLADMLGVPMSEAWTAGGLVLSFAAQGFLTRSAQETTHGKRIAATVLSALVLLLMVFRPTWAGGIAS